MDSGGLFFFVKPPSGKLQAPQATRGMQIVVDFGLGSKEYVGLVSERGVAGLTIPDWVLWCPFCEKKHKLQFHGSYGRFATDGKTSQWTYLRRLYCVIKRLTVSLLPSCLAPWKHHSFEVIGDYFEGRIVAGLSQTAAMEKATKINPSRQKGAYWEQCLIDGRPNGEAYLGSGRRESFRGNTLASYIRHLKRGFKSLGDALAFHNRRIRERLGVWLL